MTFYRLVGRRFFFRQAMPWLEPFAIRDANDAVPSFPCSSPQNEHLHLNARTRGWVGGAQRLVEAYDTSRGMLLRIEGGGDFLIAPNAETICKRDSDEGLTELDQEVILGPALVLALALCGIWCLHASAAMYQGSSIVFVGESGQGKSTLAAHLSGNSDWCLVADDILPVRLDAKTMNLLPHFPQLKLSAAAQPGPSLPEHLPLTTICVLTPAEQDATAELQLIPSSLAVQVLLRHTAGTRMFSPEMLGSHLSFCSRAARQTAVYQLTYPHRRDVLPVVRELLENLR